jgi:hypothetical protein
LKILRYISGFLFVGLLNGNVNSWDCGDLEGSKIYSADGDYLGELGPSWKTDSIYNSSSEYSSSWSQDSIYNESSDHGNNYSNESVFNDSASSPPKIVNDDNETIGLLSTGPDWDSERKHPEDIRYTCDWD